MTIVRISRGEAETEYVKIGAPYNSVLGHLLTASRIYPPELFPEVLLDYKFYYLINNILNISEVYLGL